MSAKVKLGDEDVKMLYMDIKLAAEKYAHLARMHPDQFWAVQLLSAANMITALVDQSEKRWINGEPLIDVDTDGTGLVRGNGQPVESDAAPEKELHRKWRRPLIDDEPELFPHTHGSPELDEDAAKLEALGADPGPTLDDIVPRRKKRADLFDD